ncbi:unnamed protein product [Prunus brigantina]
MLLFCRKTPVLIGFLLGFPIPRSLSSGPQILDLSTPATFSLWATELVPCRGVKAGDGWWWWQVAGSEIPAARFRRWWSVVAGGGWPDVVAGGGWSTVVAGDRRWWLAGGSGGGGWLDMDKWHSMLTLE